MLTTYVLFMFLITILFVTLYLACVAFELLLESISYIRRKYAPYYRRRSSVVS
jgi:hypothetical protein